MTLTYCRVTESVLKKCIILYFILDTNNIITILSEKGKELALVNLYKYKLIGEQKTDNLLRWRCTNNKCLVIIFSGLVKCNVFETSGQHEFIFFCKYNSSKL